MKRSFYKPKDLYDGSELPRLWDYVELGNGNTEPPAPQVGDTVKVVRWTDGLDEEVEATVLDTLGSPTRATWSQPPPPPWLMRVWVGAYKGFGMIDDPEAPTGKRPAFKSHETAALYAIAHITRDGRLECPSHEKTPNDVAG